jgi:hypothetical protein
MQTCWIHWVWYDTKLCCCNERSFAFLTLTNVRLGQDHLFLPDVSTMYGPNHVTYVEPEVRYDWLFASNGEPA